MNKLEQFISRASPVEVERCAEIAGTSRMYLYQLAKQYAGGRCPNVRLALRIATATRLIAENNGGNTPALTVEDIAALCGEKATGE